MHGYSIRDNSIKKKQMMNLALSEGRMQPKLMKHFKFALKVIQNYTQSVED